MRPKDKPTSVDIAHLAGVSQPTVSRALRDSPLVSLETRKRVQKIARELNYKVDVNARNLRSQRTNTLALLLFEDKHSNESSINPFFLSMMGSITRAAAKHGYDVLMSFQHLSNNWSAEYEHSNKADGIIFLGYGDYTSYIKRIQRLDREGAHFVTWGPVLKDQPGHFIGCNNVQGGRLATEHLIGKGHRQIAFIGDISDQCPEFQGRYQGYLKAHSMADIDVNSNLQVSALSFEQDGAIAMQQLIDSKRAFTAVFCASDTIAIGAMNTLRKAGVRVPQDVMIVGFDGIFAGGHVSPSLTTIYQDTHKAGKILVESVLKLIVGEAIESKLLPTQLIERESTAS